jgi:hypothetical protein
MGVSFGVVARAAHHRVRPHGMRAAVRPIEEPGFGFGPAATRCAMARRYRPATDDRSVPIAAWTPPFRVVFVR